jgi:hypothetical protein
MRACLARVLIASVAALAACGPSPPGAGHCQARLPGDLVITEVFADYKAPAANQAPSGDGTSTGASTGSDAGTDAGSDAGSDAGKEWFELYNATPQPIDLTGLTVTHSRSDGSRPNTHTMRPATIQPGQYFTLGNADPDRVPAYVDYGYGDDLGDLFNTLGGTLAVACGDQEIDRADYGDVKQGHARELTAAVRPDYTLNDDPTQWCQANDAEFEAGNFGTPGAASDCRPIVTGQCSDHGALRDAVTPGIGDLVITEIMPSPKAVPDATGEWFEALAVHDVDLNGVGLDRVHDTAAPDVIDGAECLRVRAGSYVVFARSTDAAVNGMLPAAAVAGTFKFSLVAGTTAAPGDVAIVAGDTVIDAVTWTRSTQGASLQLDPDLGDPVANDSESNFCTGRTAFGAGDLGTPGAVNAQCPLLPPAGMCDDDRAGLRAIVAPAPGQLVISEVLANPANVAGATDAQREWFEVANTGAAAFDLNELVVGRIGAAGAAVQAARCIPVRAGGFAVFARSADPARNGALPAVDATFNFGLVDTNGDIQVAGRAGVLDAVRWARVTSGVSTQLDPAHLTATANDDAASFCPGTTGYGDQTNRGTPGAANLPCP